MVEVAGLSSAALGKAKELAAPAVLMERDVLNVKAAAVRHGALASDKGEACFLTYGCVLVCGDFTELGLAWATRSSPALI